MEEFAKKPIPDVPPSKALQWFLLVALVVTGSAYVVQEWAELTTSPTQVRRETKLQRLVRGQSDFLAHSKVGDEALAKKRYDVAVSEYRLALQGQNNAAGHESLGQALLKQGNPEAAFAQFHEALAMEPGLVSVASAWGLALADVGKPEEAARIFGDALQRNPDSGVLHYNLATTLLKMRTDAEGRRRMAAAAGQAPEGWPRRRCAISPKPAAIRLILPLFGAAMVNCSIKWDNTPTPKRAWFAPCRKTRAWRRPISNWPWWRINWASTPKPSSTTDKSLPSRRTMRPR
jgi:tetratricopeptide (TPR) repeat protein